MAEGYLKEFQNECPVDPEIMELLECPVCQETMFAPIEQCSLGHSLCGPCRGKVGVCPVCRVVMVGTRNFLAEQLAVRLLGRRCENLNLGCDVRMQPGEGLVRHQLSCEFRSCKCIFCGETFLSNQLVEHCHENHEDVFHGPKAEGNIVADCLQEEEFYGSLVKSHGEFFWFWWLARENIVYLGVDLCRKSDGFFMCNLQLKSVKTSEKLSFFVKLHSVDHHELGEPLIPCEKCVCANRKFLERGTNFNVVMSKIEGAMEGEGCPLVSPVSIGQWGNEIPPPP